jgi:hypothetical protein
METRIAVARNSKNFPPNFKARDDGRVDRNMQCIDEF